MSPGLPRITAIEFMRALRRDGWYVSRQEGSHVLMRNDAKPGLRCVVPVHAGKILKQSLLSDMLEDAGPTVEEFERLL